MNAALKDTIETIVDLTAKLEEAKIQLEYQERQPKSDYTKMRVDGAMFDIQHYLAQLQKLLNKIV